MGTRETNTLGRRAESARGAILIHVGIAILVLMGLSAFVLDQGVLYLARVQAQNAADAGALAGATGLALDNALDFTPTGPASVAANRAATSNTVFGDVATPTVQILNITAPPWCDNPNFPTCVQVNVYRDGTHTSAALPVYFAPIFGVISQGVQATATAQPANANFTPCMRPWLMSDKWIDTSPPANQFNGTDVYTAPTPLGSGTGWGAPDRGTSLTLTQGDPAATMDGSAYYEMGDVGAYVGAITGCAMQLAIGDAVTTVTGPLPDPRTPAAVTALVADGSVIVPVALFSPEEYAAADRSTGVFTLHIVNIMGFRVSGADFDGTLPGSKLYGTVVTAFGEIKPGPPPVGGPIGSLLKYVRLVR
jgi:Flp pilus assembly protein TadG